MLTVRRSTGRRGRLPAVLVAAALAMPLGIAAADEPGAAPTAWESVLDPGSGPTAGGTPVAVPAVPDRRIVQVSQGLRAAIALDDQGGVSQWGRDYANAPVPAEHAGAFDGLEIVQVAQADSTGLARTATGELYSWGSNAGGLLGVGDTAARSGAVAIDPGVFDSPVADIKAGPFNFVARTEAGSVYVWGDNQYGQLGNGVRGGAAATTPARVEPTGALAGLTVREVDLSWTTIHVIASNGRVYSWGRSVDGSLGIGGSSDAAATNHQSRPAAVVWPSALAGHEAVMLAAGGSSATILASNGALYSWGNGNWGSLGNNTAGTHTSTPVATTMTNFGGRAIVALARGASNGYALTEDGTVFGWGPGSGQGQGAGIADRWVPTALSPIGALAGVRVVALSAASDGSTSDGNVASVAALTEDGALVVWGRNTHGRLGVGSTTAQPTPVLTVWQERVYFGPARAAALTVADEHTWSAVTPPRAAAGLVDVIVQKGGWEVVYRDAFLYGDPLPPEVITHPDRVLVEQTGLPVTLSSTARGNTEPGIEWQWTPRGADDWRPLTEDVTSSGGQVGEVFEVETSVRVLSADDPREYRVVYTNHLGRTVTSSGAVVVGVPRPVRLVVTPRTVLVDALPGRSVDG